MFNKFKKHLYSNNPFYVISAALVLYGLFSMLAENFGKEHPLLLMGGLILYTSLIGGAAIFVVRYARAWDDIRSILLIFTLLLVAATILLDLIALDNYFEGCLAALCLWLFSLFGSRLLINGMGFIVNKCYQIIWAMFLSFFIFWPIIISSYITYSEPVFCLKTLGVLITLFPIICSGIICLLIWADRQSNELQYYGPWSWPWAPHLVFAFLIGGTFLKSWVLHFTYFADRDLNGHTVLFYYFPIMYTVSFYLTYLGRVNKNDGVQYVAQYLPLATLMLFWKSSSDNLNAETFFDVFRMDGALVYMFGLLMALQYGVYWYKKIPGSGFGFFVSLIMVGWIDTGSMQADLLSWSAKNWLWLLAGALLTAWLRVDLKKIIFVITIVLYYSIEGLLTLNLSRHAWIMIVGMGTLVLGIAVSLSKKEV